MSEQEPDDGRRVLLVAASNRRRGAEMVTSRLKQSLVSQGWTIDAVALTVSDDRATADLATINSVSSSSAGRLNRHVLNSLRRRLKSTTPHLVVAMGGSTLRYVALATMGLDTRVAYFAIGEPKYWLTSHTATYLNRALYRRVDRVIAVSRMTADQLVELEPGLTGRVDVAYTGVDEAMFDVTAGEHDGATRLLFVGSLSREKDPLLALDVLARLPAAELRLVGSGPMAGEVQEAAHRLGLEARVELTGPVDDITEHLKWADLLLLTSCTEGLPGVVLEAAAAGVPAVGVDVGGVAEAIVDDVTGLVVSREPENIASAIDEVASDPRRLAALGAAAKERARTEFTQHRSAQRFESIFEGILA